MKNKKIISGVLAVVLSLTTTEASFASCSQLNDAEKNGGKENYAGDKTNVSGVMGEERKIHTFDLQESPDITIDIQETENSDDTSVVESGELGILEDNIKYQIFKDGSMIISGEGSMNDFSSSPIRNRSLIKKVIIQDQNKENEEVIKNIGDHVFDGCINLSEIDIPQTITEIGSYAFNDCTSLTEIIIPDGVIKVKDCAFKGCTAAEKAYVGKEINAVASGTGWDDEFHTIGCEVFKGCYALKEIKMPVLQTKLSFWENEWCAWSVSDLFEKSGYEPDIFKKSEYEPNDEKSEGTLNGYSLEKIIVTSGVSIPLHEFQYMTGVKEIVLPDTIEDINSFAFYKCVDLEKVNIPVTLQRIADGTFKDCNKLSRAYIPENVEYIGISAFENCTSIPEIIIPDKVTKVKKNAFNGCSSATKAYIGKGINKILIPTDNNKDTDNTIEYEAFKGCTALNEIEMPVLQTEFLGGKNDELYSVWSIHDLFENREIESIEEKDISTLNGYSLEKIIITSGTMIPFFEFENMYTLKGVYIPSSITEIQPYAFTGCENLTDIYYDDTKEKWEEVRISEGNDSLKNATIHFKDQKRTVGTDQTDPEVLEPLRGCGDIDCSKVTDLTDLLTLSMYLLNDIDITEGSLVYADMTKDGEVDIADLPALRQVIMGEVLKY